MRAGARDADAVIAITPDDATNLLVVLLAKRRLGVRWTVVRANDPAHRWLFTSEAGVDVVVSTSELVARLVQEEVTAGDLVIRGEGVLLPDRAGPRGPATWSWRSASPASSMRCTTC